MKLGIEMPQVQIEGLLSIIDTLKLQFSAAPGSSGLLGVKQTYWCALK
jgi:hypothetical protein